MRREKKGKSSKKTKEPDTMEGTINLTALYRELD